MVLAVFKQLLINLYYCWLWVFDRLILYPMIRYLTPRMGVEFLNLGYWPVQREVIDEDFLEDEEIEALINTHSTDSISDSKKSHLFIYEKTLSQHPSYPNMAKIDLLEVGCGMGNGLKWINTTRQEIGRCIGIDKVPPVNIPFVYYGDAENLHFMRNSFDLVLNIESSHLYKNMTSFLNECFRVLRPGGFLCWADVRFPIEIIDLHRQAKNTGFELVNFKDITSNVIEGIHHTSQFYDSLINKLPFFLKPFTTSLRSTYCAPGTTTYQRLQKRERVYLLAMWKKPFNRE